MIKPEDCDFHFKPDSHWQWAETIALPYAVPEANINGLIYIVTRPMLGVAMCDVTIIDSTTASRGDSGTSGPDIRIRAGLSSRYGCKTRSTTSRSSEPRHFSLLSRLCASASAPSRPSNVSRSALLALRKVCTATACRIASVFLTR